MVGGARDLEVVDDDHHGEGQGGDVLELVAERPVVVPVRIQVEDGRALQWQLREHVGRIAQVALDIAEAVQAHLSLDVCRRHHLDRMNGSSKGSEEDRAVALERFPSPRSPRC